MEAFFFFFQLYEVDFNKTTRKMVVDYKNIESAT